MSDVDKGYELMVLKMTLNKYLDEITSITEESLRVLEVNRDQVVWDLATKIYSQSGHKVELSTVRDVVNSRIGAMKYQLTAEKERIAEPTRRVAEQKAQQADEEAHRVAIQEAYMHAQMASILLEFGGDESKAQVFVRVRKIISDQLGIEENVINLNSHLSNDLGVDEDSYELTELVMALEEEFDIEITDNETEDELGIYYSSGYSGYSSTSGGSFWSMLGSISAMSSSSYSSSVSAGANCVVRSFVDLVYKKLIEKR